MIMLNKGVFAPWVVIISIAFIPVCIGSAMAFYVLHDYVLLNVAIVFSLVYLIACGCAKKHSKSNKYYLILQDDKLIIKYPDMQSGENEITINRSQVLQIEYYSICSVESWFMLYNFLLPQCAYITYLSNGEEKCWHMGYPGKDDLISFCKNTGIKLTLK
ncbi:MAG: hypothetical protein E7438_05415 [Ruminococcaceae bacterium]|nr:hypothetical protein [Oscillospiraceae bacterium]